MGKDLHYSIRPFIERALANHRAVNKIENIETDDFYAYRLQRNFGMSTVVVVLSDEYYFGAATLASLPTLLKKGGFYLIARPEASNFEINLEEQKISVGKIGHLLGALNQEEFWKYTAPTSHQKKKN